MSDGRLRGWKQIADYLGVSPGTAVRWARRPGFPVVRIGEGGSVYADKQALDRWLAAAAGTSDDASVGSGPDGDGPVLDARSWIEIARRAVVDRPRAMFGVVAAIALVGAVSFILLQPGAKPSVPGDTDAGLAADYLEARADWAERSPASLARATAKFRLMISQHPDYQPAFTGLADAYILSCEFDNVDREAAFAAARAAVTTALALEPDDADANRVAGFLEYWTHRDLSRARPYFERAVRARPGDYLIHLWYGNALIDGGRVREGSEHLRRAVILAPDSPAVLTDYAIALWQAGDRPAALQRLAAVERRFPTHSAAPGAAALFYLQAGDVNAYLAASRRWASLIRATPQLERLDREQAAYDAGGAPAVLKLMSTAPALETPFWHGGNLPAAIAAARLGDRRALLDRLKDVSSRRENWRDLDFPAGAFEPWRDDPELKPLLDAVFGRD